MGEERLSDNQPPSNRRLTVPQAAAARGITQGAVLGRVKLGTLRSYRESGKVYLVPEGAPEGVSSSPSRDEPTGPQSDRFRSLQTRTQRNSVRFAGPRPVQAAGDAVPPRCRSGSRLRSRPGSRLVAHHRARSDSCSVYCYSRRRLFACRRRWRGCKAQVRGDGHRMPDVQR